MQSLTDKREIAAENFFQALFKDHILNRFMPFSSRKGRVLLPHVTCQRRLGSFFLKKMIYGNNRHMPVGNLTFLPFFLSFCDFMISISSE